MFEKMWNTPDNQCKVKKEVNEVPIAGNLVESDIAGFHKGSGKINEIVKTGLNERIKRLNEAKLNSPPQQREYRNKIIRIQSFDEFLQIQSSDEFGHDISVSRDTILERVQTAKKLFEELENRYGIAVPAHFFIGKDKNGNEAIYSVVDKIQGMSLDSIDATSPNKVIAQTELLYASIAKYFIDNSRDDKLCLWDINNSAQYVYGRKKGEKEDKIYFIDTDIYTNKGRLDAYLNIMELAKHMSAIEKRLQKKFGRAREYILQFLNEPMPEETDNSKRQEINENINAIKKYLD